MPPVLQLDEYQEARAPDGLTGATWKKKLKEKYPEPSAGVCREVSKELEEQLELAQMAAALWQDQVTLIKDRIREEMGGAEIATIGGKPFMIRKMIPYVGHFVSAGIRDTLARPPKDED